MREQSLLQSIADITAREQALAGSLRESNTRLAAIQVEASQLKRALDQAGLAAPHVPHVLSPPPEAYFHPSTSPVDGFGATGDTRVSPEAARDNILSGSTAASKKQDFAGDLKVAGARASAAASAVAGAASTVTGALVTVGRFIGKKARSVLTQDLAIR